MLVERLRSLCVRDIMCRRIFAIAARQPMSDIAGHLLRHEISAAPVVDTAGICVGFISATDFLKRENANQAATLASPNGLTPHVWKPDDVAETYMSTGVQSIAESASLSHAAKIMCMQHIHRLPVIDAAGKPVGMISSMDIVAALSNAAEEWFGS